MQIKDEEDFRLFLSTFKEVIKSGKWGPVFSISLEEEDKAILKNMLLVENLAPVFIQILEKHLKVLEKRSKQ